jgi:gamma-glutamyltranspeptidase/glutathione hydrolase
VFYRGPISRAIADFSAANGGLFTTDDFADLNSDLGEPVHTSYRGFELYQPAPPSQGLTLLEMLNILEGFPLGAMDPSSPDLIHLMVEAKKLAFADRIAHCGDPRFVDMPLARLLSKDYAATRRAALNPARAAPFGAEAQRAGGETTACCAVDTAGNAVVLIHSLASNWGSG